MIENIDAIKSMPNISQMQENIFESIIIERKKYISNQNYQQLKKLIYLKFITPKCRNLKTIITFIEEIVISDYSDSSDTKKTDYNEKMKHQLLTLNSEAVIIRDLANSSVDEEIEENVSKNKETMEYTTSEHSLVKDKKETFIKQEVQILHSIAYSDDENLLNKKTGTTNEETTIKKKEITNKLMVNELVNEQVKQTEKYLEYFRCKYENFAIDEDLFVANAPDDNNKTEHTNSKTNHDQDPLLLESDDWYYLNIANTSKISSIKNNISSTEKNMELDHSKLNQNVVKKINRKINVKVKKLKRKPRNKNKSIVTQEKIKLQGKIVKRSIQTPDVIQNVCDETNFPNEESMQLQSLPITENVNNVFYNKSMESILGLKKEPLNDIFYKTEQVCIIKEETILPDCYVAEPIENSKATLFSDDTTIIKIDCSKDNIHSNLNEMDQEIYNEEKITNYFKEKRRIKPRSIIECSTCGKVYERVGHFRRHQIICNTLSKKINNSVRTVMFYECVMCPYKTKNKNAFRNHLGNHILGKAYKNPNYNGRAKGIFKRRRKKMNPKEFCPPSYLKAHCVTCNEEMTAIERTANCKKCLGMFVYWCVLCHKDFPTYSRLRRHVLDNLKVSTLQKCSKCGKSSYTSICRLRRHEMLCGTKAIMQCNKIPYVRLVRYNAQIIQHSKGPWRTLQTHCPKCNIMIIVLDRKAKCEKCDSLLLYKCEICNELLSTYLSLRTHVLEAHIIDSQECNEFYGEPNYSNYKTNYKDKISLQVHHQDINEGTTFQSSVQYPNKMEISCGQEETLTL